MDWFHGAAYGAAGGGLIEFLVFNTRVLAWQAARREAREAKRRKLPAFRNYVDPSADLAAALSRLLLGAMAGWLLHSQVTGVYAAVAVGASAPAVVKQLGSFRTAQELVQGSGPLSLDEGNPKAPKTVPLGPTHPLQLQSPSAGEEDS